MFYLYNLYLAENRMAEIDWVAIAAVIVSSLVAVGTLIGIYIHILVKGLEAKHEATNKRVDALEELIRNQITVDSEVKTQLAVLSEQIKALVERIDRDGV